MGSSTHGAAGTRQRFAGALTSLFLILLLFIASARYRHAHAQEQEEYSIEGETTNRIETINRMRRVVLQIGYLITPSSKENVTFVASGIPISPNGHVLTCKHVLENLRKEAKRDNTPGLLDRLVVAFQEDSKSLSYTNASVFYEDPQLDIAILKSELSMPAFREAIRFGNSSEVRIATEVTVCGYAYPSGRLIPPFVFRGIVSNIWEQNERTVFQTDIEAYPGLSGSPVFVTDTGEIIGIIKSTYSPQNIPTKLTYFIPIDSIKPIIETLVSTEANDEKTAGPD